MHLMGCLMADMAMSICKHDNDERIIHAGDRCRSANCLSQQTTMPSVNLTYPCVHVQTF